MAFGRMGEGENPVGTARALTDNLLNVGTALVQAQAAQKIATQSAEAAKQQNRAATTQAAAIASQSVAAQNVAQINAQAAAANTKKWMWIIGGSVVGLAVLGFIYYKYIRK